MNLRPNNPHEAAGFTGLYETQQYLVMRLSDGLPVAAGCQRFVHVDQSGLRTQYGWPCLECAPASLDSCFDSQHLFG